MEVDIFKKQEKVFEEYLKKGIKAFHNNIVICDDNYFRQRVFTSIIQVPKEVADKVKVVSNSLKKVFPDQYFISKNKMHITLVGLFDKDINALGEDDIDRINDIFRRCLNKYKPFEVEMRGINIGPSAVIVKIYDKGDLDTIRQCIIAEVKKLKINLGYKKLKFYSDVKVGWSTLMRFRVGSLQHLEEELLKYKDYRFGKFIVKKVELIIASHDMDKKNMSIIDTVNLRGA